MKRLLPKSVIDHAKIDLYKQVLPRIVKNANNNECWHLKSVDGYKIVDAVCHFSNKGKTKIFFKAKRLVFELIKGDLPEGFVVYQACNNRYCVNPNHHYSKTQTDYIGILRLNGTFKTRKGFKHKPETIAKISHSHQGKKLNKETRLKMSLKKIGIKRDPELVAKVAEQHFRGEKTLVPN